MKLDRLLTGAGIVLGAAMAARQVQRARRRISFAGRTVIICGGSRGLGLILARELAEEGADLMLVARTREDLERARCELRSITGREVVVHAIDVTEDGAMRQVIDDAIARTGRIDVLMNCAGVIQVGPFDHMTRADFERALATHLWGPLAAMQAVIPVMRSQGQGRIVNVSSIGGRVAMPHQAPYAASKFALFGLSDAVGDEVARDGIRVTTVCPGTMRTGSHVNIDVKGRHESEYAWFAAAASMPFLSMDATSAARKILRACRYGERRLTVGLPARIAVVADTLLPELMPDLMSVVNRLMPDSEPLLGDTTRTGWDSLSSTAPRLLTARADRVVAEHNELRGHAPEELLG